MDQTVEKGSFLTAATLLVSTGVVLIEKNLTAGTILVVLGCGLFFLRELRKK